MNIKTTRNKTSRIINLIETVAKKEHKPTNLSRLKSSVVFTISMSLAFKVFGFTKLGFSTSIRPWVPFRLSSGSSSSDSSSPEWSSSTSASSFLNVRGRVEVPASRVANDTRKLASYSNSTRSKLDSSELDSSSTRNVNESSRATRNSTRKAREILENILYIKF